MSETALVAAITVLAAALRLYRLDAQSLWLDEYLAVRSLHAPDVWTHLLLLGVQAPEQMASPLYYVLQYFFAQWISVSPDLMRLLPITLGVVAVPLLYGLARDNFGKGTALVAALCLALSPQHIWHAQELRNYELVTLLAILSVWALLRARRDGRLLWWVVNLGVNALLVWTHLFTVLLIFAEGLYLLLFMAFRWQSFRRFFAWGLVQMLLLAPWLFWLSYLPYVHSSYSSGLWAWDVFCNIFGCDIVRYHTDLLPAWKTHPWGAATARFPELIPLCRRFDAALLSLFVAAATWALLDVAWNFRASRRNADDAESRRPRLEQTTMLLILLVVPGLVAALIEVYRHVIAMNPMYTMYNQIALYILVGAALMRLPWLLLRSGAVAVLAGLYAFQLLVFLPEVTRTNWRSAAAYLHEHAGPHDQVVQVQRFWPERELEYYLAPARPVQRVWTFQAACDDSLEMLRAIPSGDSPETEKRSVWIVFQRLLLKWVYPSADPVRLLDDALRTRGLTGTYVEFPGHYNAVLCKVENTHPVFQALGEPVESIVPGDFVWKYRLKPIDYEQVLGELGLGGSEQIERQASCAALRASIDHWPLDTFPMSSKYCYLDAIADLLNRGHVELAEAMAHHGLAAYPEFGLLHLALGAVLEAKGDQTAAISAMQRATELHPGLGRLLGRFLTTLAEEDSAGPACQVLAELDRVGFVLAPLLEYGCCRALSGVGHGTADVSIDGP